MPRKEYVGYKIDAAKDGSRISHYLLRLIRIGKAFLDYDLHDFLKVLRGEKPDREEIEEEEGECIAHADYTDFGNMSQKFEELGQSTQVILMKI